MGPLSLQVKCLQTECLTPDKNTRYSIDPAQQTLVTSSHATSGATLGSVETGHAMPVRTVHATLTRLITTSLDGTTKIFDTTAKPYKCVGTIAATTTAVANKAKGVAGNPLVDVLAGQHLVLVEQEATKATVKMYHLGTGKLDETLLPITLDHHVHDMITIDAAVSSITTVGHNAEIVCCNNETMTIVECTVVDGVLTKVGNKDTTAFTARTKPPAKISDLSVPGAKAADTALTPLPVPPPGADKIPAAPTTAPPAQPQDIPGPPKEAILTIDASKVVGANAVEKPVADVKAVSSNPKPPPPVVA